MDVSFISLKYILPAVYALLLQDSDCVILVKPQFEAGRKALNKHGIVKSESVRKQVLQEILEFAQQTGFTVQASCESPVHGGDGNIEYLAWLRK